MAQQQTEIAELRRRLGRQSEQLAAVTKERDYLRSQLRALVEISAQLSELRYSVRDYLRRLHEGNVNNHSVNLRNAGERLKKLVGLC